jgi:hypothetical protein
MTTLHHLARIGNMREIRRWAARLQAEDARYGPFAARLERLASDYQSQAILALVEMQLAAQQAAPGGD